MENQKEIAMLEDIRKSIVDVFVNENWRNLGLEKVDLYLRQSENCKMLKILRKLRDFIELYELASARELIRQELTYLKGIEKESKLKRIIKKVVKILDDLTYDEYENEILFGISEPNYKLTKDEIEELFYYIDHFDEIYRVRKEKRLMNQLKRKIGLWIWKKNKELIKL